MTKWKLVPVKALEELRNSVSGRVNMGSVWEAAVIDSMLEAAPQPPKLSDERIWELIGEYKALSGASGKEARLVNLARAIEREILGGDT
jgi:hypothetical protein